MQQQPRLPSEARGPGRPLATANASEVRAAAPAAPPPATGPASTAPATAPVRATPAPVAAPVRAPVAAAPVRAAIVAGPIRDGHLGGVLRPTAVMAGRIRASPPETTLQIPLETLVVVVVVLLVAVAVALALRLRRRTRQCDFLVRGNAMRIHEGEAPQDPIVEAQGDRPTGGWRRRAGPVTMLAGAGGEGGRVTEGDDSSYSTTDAGDDWSGDADDEATGLEARGDAPPAGDGSESVMAPRPTGGQEEDDDGDDSDPEESQFDYSNEYIDEQTIENFIMALITQQEKENQCGTLPQESSSSA